MKSIEELRKKSGQKLPSRPRIAFLDIETAPNLGWFWEMWETNPIGVKTNWHLLSFSVKIMGEKKVRTYALPDYPIYKRNKEEDKFLVQDLWKVMNEADIIIAHNGDNFDIRKSNARFIFHRMRPPAPYKTIDTLKIARKHFKFDSNKLSSLGKYLGVGDKIPTTGAHLWFGCMNGDMKSWATMRAYNEQDVNLLEQVYLRLRPWSTTHPNLSLISRDVRACPNCQGHKLQRRGYCFGAAKKLARLQCQDCGKWSSMPVESVEKVVLK